jgi:hypothetical protein
MYHGNAVSPQLEALGVEGLHVAVALKPLTNHLFENAITFAM